MNRGSKIRVKPFSAKLLSAFENEKITVYAEETIFTNRISRERTHKLNSVNVTWKLQIFTSAVKKFIWRNFWNQR